MEYMAFGWINGNRITQSESKEQESKIRTSHIVVYKFEYFWRSNQMVNEVPAPKYQTTVN
ncbi:unnamed protein product, partial [Ceratitis capitata]